MNPIFHRPKPSPRRDLADLESKIRVIGVKQDEMDKRLTSSIDSMRNELRSEIKSVDSKVDQIDKKRHNDRRMTIMEAKMKGMERK